jgi:hypothetical protein
MVITLVAMALVVGVGGLLYAFGTPEAPPTAAAKSSAEGAMRLPGEPAPPRPKAQMPPDGQLPPADPNSPLAIQIPGCVCHSDDPKLVEEHAGYRMNQCAGCHAGGTPTGQ